jgi:hypothetical protein
MKQEEKAVNEVIEILRKRAEALRNGAEGTFVLILLALAGGILLFIFAANITGKVGDTAAVRPHTNTPSGPPTLPGTPPQSADSPAPQNPKETAAHAEHIGERYYLIDNISIIATRAGAVLILMFLVQILVALYRYNVRLANFFDGRADALQLMNNEDEKKFHALVGTLGGDTIEFGKVPKTPTEQVAVLATKALELAQAQSKKE